MSITLLTVFLSIFLLQNVAVAASDTGLLIPTKPINSNSDGKLFPDEKIKQMEKDKKDASLTDGLMLGWILDLFKSINVVSLPKLIFENPYGDTGKLNYGILSDGEMSKIINPLLGFLNGLYALILTGAIMISSAKFGLKAISPQAKKDFWTDINMWVLSGFFMASFWLIFKVMMSINLAFVTSLYDLLNEKQIQTNGVSLVASAGSFNVGNAFVYLAEFGLTLYLNIIYIARKVIIIFLVVASAFAAYSLVFAKTRSFFGTWVKELTGNIFLQSIHALTMYVFAVLSSLTANGAVYDTIYRLGLLIMFIPITGMLSKWLNLGDSSSKVGQVATMMGAGSIAGAMMLAKNAGGTLAGRRPNIGSPMYGGGTPAAAGGYSGGSADMGSDAGATALTMAAKGGTGWSKFKSFAGGVGAVAGGTMGLTMGPAGVAVGAKVGSATMRGGMQGARNFSAGASNAARTATTAFFPEGIKNAYQDASGSGFFSKIKDMGSTGKENFSDMWNNLSERRQFMGNLGESTGSMFGASESGRKLGHMLSGASRGRVQSANEMYGGMNDMSLPQISKRYAGMDATWEQNNTGSAFYVHTPSGKQRVSAYGAADPTLKKGETRVAEYKFPGHNEKFQRQANGSYKLPSAAPVGVGVNVGAPSISEGPVGLSGGSNEHIARTTGAYIRGNDGAKYEDNRMDAAKITPDNYFSHNVKGADRRDWSDKGADFLSKRTRNSTSSYSPPSDYTKELSGIAEQMAYENERVKNKIVL